MSEEELHDLVERAQRKDPDAWEALYRRNYRGLFAYSHRRLFSDEAADDAVSETMTRALVAIDRFRWKGAGVDAWLMGIARLVVLEQQRSALRPPAPSMPAAPVKGPLDHLIAAEQASDVRLAFEKLSSEDQELLELRVVAGLSAEGVGEVLDKKPGAVRMAQTRALGRLRVALGEATGAH